jgi:uncharacterized membrane protein
MDSTTYNVALTLHLLGALTFVAGIVLAGAAFESARRRRQPAEIALLLSITRIGVLLVALGTMLIGAFGLLMVHLARWGYGSPWVDTSIGLFVGALVLGGLGGQRPKQARRRRGSPSSRLRLTKSYARCSTTPFRGSRTMARSP